MLIEKLQILNFKNYEGVNLDFSSRINVLIGRNGSGKTNLLDAIYYLSFTKSAFNASDYQNIRHGESSFFIKGSVRQADQPHEILCGIQTGQKKNFKEDGAEYQKLSDHIGKYPVVLMAPDDVDLIREGSESRRKFFDSIISQIDKVYLENLIRYNQYIKQRNGLLKMFYDSGATDWIALESYDQGLIPLGTALYNRREAFVREFLPVFRKYYNFLVDEREQANLEYNSGLRNMSFSEGLSKNRNRDLELQRTGFGIHRDEFEFRLGDGDMKRLGSQGQQKSFVIALKLAQFEIIKNHKGFDPILLMDDIFDKLDDDRIKRLLELLKRDLGQLFITDARPDRTQYLLGQVDLSASVFNVERGNICRQ